jgi:uncharacterized membrane protein
LSVALQFAESLTRHATKSIDLSVAQAGREFRGLTKGRLEAFSDGVLAIVITIMVLELRPPEGDTLDAVLALWPKFLAYVLSFIYIGIYWNNHHHLLRATHAISSGVLWANLHLLFWLSLVPFATAWMGETLFAPVPVAVYGVTVLMPAFAFSLLVYALRRVPGQNPALVEALGDFRKGWLSLALYALSIPVALVMPYLSVAIFILTAALWFVPDRSFERAG